MTRREVSAVLTGWSPILPPGRMAMASCFPGASQTAVWETGWCSAQFPESKVSQSERAGQFVCHGHSGSVSKWPHVHHCHVCTEEEDGKNAQKTLKVIMSSHKIVDDRIPCCPLFRFPKTPPPDYLRRLKIRRGAGAS